MGWFLHVYIESGPPATVKRSRNGILHTLSLDYFDALELAARRRVAPEAVTIYTDAQAAMRRIVADEPGPGQKYAVLARK